MGTVRRILDLDPKIDARIEAIAMATGQDAAAVVAAALELLDSVINTGEPDVEEDIRRLEEFERGTAQELSRPQPRQVGSLSTDDLAELDRR